MSSVIRIDALALTPTKLSPEESSNPVVRRLRLHDLLSAGMHGRATVVTAAAGYGKSTLLSSYLSSTDHLVIWYRLHEDDADPARFLSHLAEGFRRSILDFDQQLLRVPSDGRHLEDFQNLLATLLGHLANSDAGHAALVLDDFHAVAHSPSVSDTLDYLLKYLPGNFHLFISSRTDLATPQLARLRQYGEVLDLCEADLAFTVAEAVALLREWGLGDVSESEVLRIWDRTRGWPAALQMVCRQPAPSRWPQAPDKIADTGAAPPSPGRTATSVFLQPRGANPTVMLSEGLRTPPESRSEASQPFGKRPCPNAGEIPPKSDPIRTPATTGGELQQPHAGRGSTLESVADGLDGALQPICDYFDFHLLRTQPPAVRTLMEKTAYLFELTPAAAEGILGIANAGETLADLCHSHTMLFRRASHRGQPAYCYHPLFGDFLRARFQPREGVAAVRQLHLDCGRFYEIGESWEAALHHFCEGQHWSLATRIIRLRASWLIRVGELPQVWDWLGRIPEGILGNDPWLLLFRGRILRLRGRLQQASTCLHRAERLFRQQKERAGLSRALFELGAITLDLRKPTEGLHLLEEALRLAPKGDDHLRAETHAFLIMGYAAGGLFVEAADSFDRAVSLSERVTEPRSALVLRVRAMRRLAWAQWQQGRMRAALQLAEQALDLCQAEALDERSLAHCLRVAALVHAARGDFKRALGLMESSGEVAARHDLTDLLNKVNSTKADVLAANDELALAESLYAAGGGSWSDSGGLGYVWLRQGRLGEARQACLAEMRDAEERGAKIDLGRARALLGVVALESGDLDAAEQHLVSGAGQFDRLQSEYRLAGVRMHLARLCYARRQSARGRRYLLEALQFAEREQCYNFFLWLPDTIAFLAAEALKENLAREYVTELCSRRLTSAQLRFLLPLASENDSVLRELATRLVIDLARAGAPSPTDVDPLLDTCKDERLRSRIINALAEQRLTIAGILRLRHAYGLTWREIDVFARYYLPSSHTPVSPMSGPLDGGSESHRANLAKTMCITDNTLRYHISSIRRKLNLLGRKGGISVYQWALGEGIVGQFADPPL